MSSADTCIFCSCGISDETNLGERYQINGTYFHEYCLLQSNVITKRLNGVRLELLLKLILDAVKRNSEVACVYCGHYGATLRCETCEIAFDLPCGIINKCLPVFTSVPHVYCEQHRPYQSILAQALEVAVATPPTCPICTDIVDVTNKSSTIWAPCCKESWFHRRCLQMLPSPLKCPVCSDQKKFKEEMMQNGVLIMNRLDIKAETLSMISETPSQKSTPSRSGVMRKPIRESKITENNQLEICTPVHEGAISQQHQQTKAKSDHVQHAKKKSYICDYDGCSSAYTSSGGLKYHQRTHTGQKPYNCGYEGCSSAFAASRDLKIHQRMHAGKKPYICDYDGCSSAYISSFGLKYHQRTHTGEKPYMCDYDGCSSAFPSSFGLKYHQRTHTGQKPYNCGYEGCSSAFAASRDLKIHQRMHAGKKPYICDYDGCSSAYTSSFGLKYHQRTHTGEKPYMCDYDGCSIAFPSPGGLTYHRLTHTGQKPYMCDYDGCSRAFAASRDLNIHQRTHTGEKPYKCDYDGCSNAYPRLNSLRYHQWTHTREKP